MTIKFWLSKHHIHNYISSRPGDQALSIMYNLLQFYSIWCWGLELNVWSTFYTFDPKHCLNHNLTETYLKICSERWPQIFAQNVKSANRSYRLSLGGDYLPLGPDYIFLALLLHLLCKVSFLHLLHNHSIFLHLQLKMYLYNVLFSSTMQSIFSSFSMQRFYSTPNIQSVCLYWKES